jgi:two-component system sensor kinase FixL
MSYVTILWSIAGAAAFLLGLVHAFVCALDRRAWGNLAFAVVAFSVAGIVPTELGMMHAASPQEWSSWLRWSHVPIYFAAIGVVLFVALYLGTGRPWLGWMIVVMHTLILATNFAADTNFHFERVNSIDPIPFLGGTITVAGDAVTGSWHWLATLSGLLMTYFVADAAVALWRRGNDDARRRAAAAGGGLVVFVAMSFFFTQLEIGGMAKMPVIFALPFLLTVGAMTFELSRDIFRAPLLARELRESERRLELATRAGGLGLWSWDIRTGRIWTTKIARRLLGFSQREASDPQRWRERIHPADSERVRLAVDNVLRTGGEYDIEHRIALPDNATRWVAAHGQVERNAAGQPTLLRGVLHDVTSLRSAQDESRELRRNLAHAGRVSMLGQLASALAHELSQPLAAILRNSEAAEMMLRGNSPDLEELRAIVADIHGDDQRAAEVISRLQTLLKRRHLDFEAISVDGLVRDVSSLVRPDAVAKRVTLEYAVEAGLPALSGDRVHLSQVLINLIINGMDAIASSEQPRGLVRVAARPAAERAVELSVIDSGTGIPPHMLSRLFEPFFTTKENGMGMGLAVSRTIVEAHGGRFWAENNPAGGATFRFTIPTVQVSRG